MAHLANKAGPSKNFMSLGPSTHTIKLSSSCLSSKTLGVKRVNQYVLLKTLGKGASSTVVQCLMPNDTGNDNEDAYFAMKIIKRSFFKQSHSTLI